MTADELVSILGRAFEEESSPMGDTPIGRLLQTAFSKDQELAKIQSLLDQVSILINTADQWLAFSFLIDRLKIKNPIVGESIEQRLSNGIIFNSESRLWAARSAINLGATLTDKSYKQLNSEKVVETNPTLWLVLMFDTMDTRAALKRFRSLPGRVDLTPSQASDAIRCYKKWVSRIDSVEVDFNSPLSDFLYSLPAYLAVEVSRKLTPIIGPSFLEVNFERLNREKKTGVSIMHTSNPISNQYSEAGSMAESCTTTKNLETPKLRRSRGHFHFGEGLEELDMNMVPQDRIKNFGQKLTDRVTGVKPKEQNRNAKAYESPDSASVLGGEIANDSAADFSKACSSFFKNRSGDIIRSEIKVNRT